MPAAEQLRVGDVRARLFDALDPLVRGVARIHGPEAAEALTIWVRPVPLPGETAGSRVILQTDTEVTAGMVALMPNQAELTAAVDDVLAVALAALGEDAASDAVNATEQRTAVLLVKAQPATGAVSVVLVPKRGRAIVLGALVDAPSVSH